MEATAGSWYTGASPGTKLAVGTGTIDLTVSGKASFLTSTIAGSAIRFDSKSVEGINCSATNPTSTSATIGCQALEFSGVTVSGPAATGCLTLPFITTKPLTGKLGMNKAGTVATLEISPKAGSGTAFATVELTGTCANAGPYKVTGVVYAQAKNATGVFAFTQELSVSKAIQEDAGTATSLKFGANAAIISGSLSGESGLGLTGGGFKKVEWAGKED